MNCRVVVYILFVLIQSGCSRHAEDHYNVAPQSNWPGHKLTGNTVTCTFPWIMEADYFDKSIHYTNPQVQKLSWVVAFTDLDKPNPRVVFRHSSGSYEMKGIHGLDTDQKATLVALFDEDDGLAAFTIFRETGIAVYSWQGIKTSILGDIPRVRSAMGTCQ